MNHFNNIISFEEFQKEIHKLTAIEKGTAFELLTKYIFLLHPNFKNTTKNIYLYNDLSKSMLKQFNLPSYDKGIDLIVQTIDDEYYPIQCKYRDDKFKTVNWTNLSTFVGQAFGISNFKSAIYVTNTIDIDEEVCRSTKIECIYGDFFDTLDKEFFDNIRNYNKEKECYYKKTKLRDYQMEFLASCIKYFKTNNRGYGTLACGTGKSIMSYYVDKFMLNKLTIIFVPSLYLLSQIFRDWSHENINDIYTKFLLIGSDADVNEKNYKNNGLFITTNIEEIKEKINKYKNNKLIIISTYQSSDKLSYALNNKIVDLIIFDEAHKTVSQEGLFSKGLDNKFIKSKKRLFMTATPKVYKSNDDNKNDKIISMDNETLYGKEIYNYSIRKGIDENFLSDYEIVAMAFTEKKLEEYKKSNKLINYEKEIINFHY